MHRTPVDPSEKVMRRVLYVLGLAFLLHLFFGACARNAPPAVSLGGDTLETADREKIAYTIRNDHQSPVTVKIQDQQACGSRNYRISERQIKSGTSVTDTIRASRLAGLTLCALVNPVPGRTEVPPQFRQFSLYRGAHLYLNVANDVTHSSLWIR